MNWFNKQRALAIIMMVFTMFSTVNAEQKRRIEEPLSTRRQRIISIAATAAKGDLSALDTRLHQGLDAGLTVNEIKEVMVHLYAYCGFPRSIRGLQTLMGVLDERKAKGINDQWGAEASPVKDTRSKYERGREILGRLTGAPQDGPRAGYAAFSPELEIFLKEHLFADIFERDVLNFSDRELVTIAVLASIGGVEPMLQSHLAICLNVGLTPGQLKQFVDQIRSVVGKKEGRTVQAVLDEVLKNKRLKSIGH